MPLLPPRFEMIRRVNAPVAAFVDPKASFTKDAIKSTDDFVGRCILLQTCSCCQESPCVVRVEKIAYVESPEGFRYLARLAGKVVWGEVRWKRVDINRLSYYKKRGWKQSKSLGGYLLGFPDSKYQAYVRKTGYHVLSANRFQVIAQTSLDLVDLVTDATICYGFEIQNPPPPPLCNRIVTTRCTSFICRKNCEVVENLLTLQDCNCPDGFVDNPLGSCFWMDWASCQRVTCPKVNCIGGLWSCSC